MINGKIRNFWNRGDNMIAIKNTEMPKSCEECPLTYLDMGDDAYFGISTRRCVFDGSNVDGLFSERDYDCPLVDWVDFAYIKNIEAEIRAELDKLTTYRVPNSNTDLVTLTAVKRVLNLVFRGNREKEKDDEDKKS